MADSSAKIAIVTGANSGIGLETAVGLAAAGCHVVMACRSRERAEQARADILSRLPAASLEIRQLDLGDYASVGEFAAGFRADRDRLDLLINNAGVLDYSGRTNDRGHELQLATNHLGHFLLTAELIDMVPDEPASRIVSLSSIAHKRGEIRFDDIHCKETKGGIVAYAQSKLACLLFGDELHRRLARAGRKITSLTAHPGGTDSGLFDDMPRLQYHFMKLFVPFMIHGNEAAAQPSLHAALSPDVKGGEYYGPQGFLDLKGPVGIARRTDYSKDEAVAARLWALSEELVGRSFEI